MRVAAQKARRRVLDEGGRQAGQHADEQVPLLLAADGLDGALDLANAGEDAVDLLVEPHAARRRGEAAAQPLEQAKAGILLEMRDELAHGGLRDVQHFGGAADRARLDHRLEGLDLAQVGDRFIGA